MVMYQGVNHSRRARRWGTGALSFEMRDEMDARCHTPVGTFSVAKMLLGCILTSFMMIILLGASAGSAKSSGERGFLRYGKNSEVRYCAAKVGANPFPIYLNESSELAFLAIGDWGLDQDSENDDGPRKDWELDELKQLSKHMSLRPNSQFVLNMGDNFYQYGIRSVDDSRWVTTFENNFADLDRSMPWFSMLGNHDYKGNLLEPRVSLDQGVRAEVLRTFHEDNQRWCMPDTNYTVSISTKTFDLHIVVFDSQTIVRVDPYEDTGAYDGPMVKTREGHLAWLENTVCDLYAKKQASMKPTWIVTASHHFASVSVGNYYFDAKSLFGLMQSRVEPVLKKCGVNVHFNGHDHVTQVIDIIRNESSESPITQVGVGCAGKSNGNVKGDQNGLDIMYGVNKYKLQFATNEDAFASCHVTADSFSISLFDRLGKNTYTQSIAYE